MAPPGTHDARLHRPAAEVTAVATLPNGYDLPFGKAAIRPRRARVSQTDLKARGWPSKHPGDGWVQAEDIRRRTPYFRWRHRQPPDHDCSPVAFPQPESPETGRQLDRDGLAYTDTKRHRTSAACSWPAQLSRTSGLNLVCAEGFRPESVATRQAVTKQVPPSYFHAKEQPSLQDLGGASPSQPSHPPGLTSFRAQPTRRDQARQISSHKGRKHRLDQGCGMFRRQLAFLPPAPPRFSLS